MGIQTPLHQLLPVSAAGMAFLGFPGATLDASRADETITLFDSRQFADTTIYPAGDLRAVADGKAQWTPASGSARPAQVVAFDTGPSERGLRRHQTAAHPIDADWLDFPHVADTRLTVKFDARVSSAQSRTLDLFLLRPEQTGPSHQASVLIWGYHPGYLSYFDGGYHKLSPIDDEWHSYEIAHDLKKNTFEVVIDGETVARELPWRNRFSPGTAFGRLRIATIRGDAGEYAELTNLRILAEPAPPSISIPGAASRGGIIAPGGVFEFEVTSDLPVHEGAIRLELNGEDLTGSLRISGSPRARWIALDHPGGFAPDTTYNAIITASNERGTTTLHHSFYTFVDQVDGYRGIWFTLGQMSGEFGDKYSGGLAFCFSHTLIPMAIYAPEVDKTFFVYGGTTGAENRHLLIMASYYDHMRNVVPRPTIVRDQRGVDDPHDNPSLTIDPDGHVWVFIAGRGRRRPGQIFRATEPFSVREFEEIEEREMTYSQIWHVPENGFFHLLTKYTRGRELYWETSRDGRNWSEQRKLAGFQGHYQVSRLRDATVGTAFNYHAGGSVDRRTNLYYAQTSDFGESWTTIDGRPLTTPLEETQNPALVIDYEAKGRLVYVLKLLFDEEGHPVILYVTSGGFAPGPANDPRTWKITRWTGSEWKTTTITQSDHNYDMGSLYLHADRWSLIAPALTGPQPYHTGGEIGLWESTDRGETWDFKRKITGGSSFNHSYVRRPHNPVDPFFAMWADGDSTEFSISHLYFTNSAGDRVFKLPYRMSGEEAEPVPVEFPSLEP